MFLALMIAAGIVAVTVIVVVAMRSWGKDVERTEAELHEPGTRTVAYDVPPGRDPAELMAALTHAGYRAVEEHPGRLLIACPQDDDPAKVKTLLAET